MKVLFISHEATRTGAPLVLLNVIKLLKKSNNICDVILLNTGEIEKDFIKIADKVISIKRKTGILIRLLNKISDYNYTDLNFKILILRLNKVKYDIIYANTVSSMSTAVKIKNLLKIKTVLHVHELDYAIKTIFGESNFKSCAGKIDYFIAASFAAKNNLITKYNINADKISVVYPYSDSVVVNNNDSMSDFLKMAKIKSGTFVVGGSGQLSWTKGVDIFLQIAKEYSMRSKDSDFVFIWVGGGLDTIYFEQIKNDLDKLDIKEKIVFTGLKVDPYIYYSLFSVFLFTSKEDSFGLAGLENAFLSKPIICFDKCGGFTEFISDDAGIIVPFLDINKAVDALLELKSNPEICNLIGNKAKNKAAKEFNIEVFNRRILEVISKVRKTRK